MLRQALLPLSLPLGAPHPKSDYFLMIQVDNSMYHWVLVETETGTVCENWKNAALTQEEVEAQPYLIMEVISGGAKRVLFIDEEPGSSKIRRHYEQIPIVFVYCFCHTQSQRDIVSLLFRPCQVALLEVPKHVFNDENHWSLLPLEASAAASHVRNMHLESVDEKMLLMALGDRVDAVLMTSPETLLDTFTAQLPRRYDSSGAKQKAQRGLYGFLERHIQQWCQRYVETDKELAIIVGGCEAAALLECLKRKTSNVRALPMKNAIHVKFPGDPQIYIVKLIVLETAHFDGLSTLLMAGTHDEHVVIGCGVRKLFNGEFFNGFVSTIGAFENGEKLIYGIVYEDGDTEDYFVGEVIANAQTFAKYALSTKDPKLQRKGKQSQIAIKYLKKDVDCAEAQRQIDALFDSSLFPIRRTKKDNK